MWQWLGRITIMLVAYSEWWGDWTKRAIKSHLKWKRKHFSTVSECRASTGLFFPDCSAVQCGVLLYIVGLLTEWIPGDGVGAAGEHDGGFGYSKGGRFIPSISEKGRRPFPLPSSDLTRNTHLILTQDHSAFIPHLDNPTLYFNWVHCITQVKQTRRCRLYQCTPDSTCILYHLQ